MASEILPPFSTFFVNLPSALPSTVDTRVYSTWRHLAEGHSVQTWTGPRQLSRDTTRGLEQVTLQSGARAIVLNNQDYECAFGQQCALSTLRGNPPNLPYAIWPEIAFVQKSAGSNVTVEFFTSDYAMLGSEAN